MEIVQTYKSRFDGGNEKAGLYSYSLAHFHYRNFLMQPMNHLRVFTCVLTGGTMV